MPGTATCVWFGSAAGCDPGSSIVRSSNNCLSSLLPLVEIDDGADEGLFDVAGALAQALERLRDLARLLSTALLGEQHLCALQFRGGCADGDLLRLQAHHRPLQVAGGLGNLDLALHQ